MCAAHAELSQRCSVNDVGGKDCASNLARGRSQPGPPDPFARCHMPDRGLTEAYERGSEEDAEEGRARHAGSRGGAAARCRGASVNLAFGRFRGKSRHSQRSRDRSQRRADSERKCTRNAPAA
jgi:hypothetical protein